MRNRPPSLLTSDEEKTEYWLQGYKCREGSARVIPCNYDDPDANRWHMKYPGMYDAHSSIEFTDLWLCKQILRAVLDAHAAGGERKLEHLRHFLGVK